MRTATKYIKYIDRVHARARVYARHTSRDTFLAMIKAYGAFDDPMKELYAMMDIFEVQVLDAMIAAHLAGYLRSTAVAARHLAQQKMLGPFETAISFTQRRLKIPQGQINVLKMRYGATAVTMTNQMGEAIERKTQKAIREIIEKNMHIKAGMKHLQGKLKKAINPWTLETVVRTQIQIAYGAGRWDANQASAIQEILWGYEYVTVGDSRVRPEHEMLAGVRLPKENPRWNDIWPPNGFNCRCEALEIYMDEPKRARLKDVPGSKMLKGKLIIPGPDQGWAINHGQIFTSNIVKTQKEIQAIVTKSVEKGDIMFVTDRFGKTHEVIMRWKTSGPPTPSNLAKWHKEFETITKKPAWMKKIDALVAEGKTPNWNSSFWAPKRAEYFEVASKKAVGPLKKIKVIKEPAIKEVKVEIPKKYRNEIRLEGIKDEYKDEAIKAYIDMRERFPVLDHAGLAIKGELVGSPNAMASSLGDSKQSVISVYSKFFGKKSKIDLRKVLKLDYEAKYGQAKNITELIQHEYGHNYMRTMGAGERINLELSFDRLKFVEIRKNVSLYATTKYEEMFAEMFVQVINGRASALTQEVFRNAGIILKEGKLVGRKIIKKVLKRKGQATLDFIQTRKAGWMRKIDDIVARNKVPNWKAKFWKKSEHKKYWEISTGKEIKPGIVKINITPKLKPVVEPKKIISKPSMTLKEAEEWNKTSKIKDTLYHYTSEKKTMNKIIEEGFDVSKTSYKTWQGQGVYTFDERVLGNVFGKYELPIKINVKKPFVGTVEQVEKKLTKLMEHVKPPRVVLPDGTKLKLRVWLTPADELAAKTRAWIKAGYDSIIMKEGKGRGIVIILDRRNVVVIKKVAVSKITKIKEIKDVYIGLNKSDQKLVENIFKGIDRVALLKEVGKAGSKNSRAMLQEMYAKAIEGKATSLSTTLLKVLKIKIPVQKEKIVSKVFVPVIKKSKGISSKAIGKGINESDKQLFTDWMMEANYDVVEAQLKHAAGEALTKGERTFLKWGDKFEKAIMKISGRKGTTYRGMYWTTKEEAMGYLKRYQKGAKISFRAHQATSKTKVNVTSFLGTKEQYKVLLKIQGKSGRDVTKYMSAAEDEVIFLRGARFKVLKVETKGRLTNVTLKEY